MNGEMSIRFWEELLKNNELFKKVKTHMNWNDEKVLTWFKTPNPNLGNVSPVWMIERGRYEKLEQWIDAAISEGEK